MYCSFRRLYIHFSFFSSRNTTIENCPLRCRRLWGLSQMILYVTLHRVSRIFFCTPTMLCKSAARKDCFSLIICRSPMGRYFLEKLFEGGNSLFFAHTQGLERKPVLSRVTEGIIKEWKASFWKSDLSNMPCTLPALNQEGYPRLENLGRNGDFPKGLYHRWKEWSKSSS